jgi:hypothetical protein
MDGRQSSHISDLAAPRMIAFIMAISPIMTGIIHTMNHLGLNTHDIKATIPAAITNGTPPHRNLRLDMAIYNP